MSRFGMVRAKNLDFIVVDQKKIKNEGGKCHHELKLESFQSNLVSLNSGRPEDYSITLSKQLQKIHAYLFEKGMRIMHDENSHSHIYVFMSELSSEIVNAEGLKVTYSVTYPGPVLRTQHLIEIEERVEEIQSEVELYLKKQFQRISESTGIDAHVI